MSETGAITIFIGIEHWNLSFEKISVQKLTKKNYLERVRFRTPYQYFPLILELIDP
jgi:hypothetical protein